MQVKVQTSDSCKVMSQSDECGRSASQVSAIESLHRPCNKIIILRDFQMKENLLLYPNHRTYCTNMSIA